MASVVFLRGVNVGGHRTFQPSVLAKEMAELGVVSIGAAGTFVVGKAMGQAALRAEFLKRLSFDAELMICRASELIDLSCGEPFPEDALVKDAKRYVSVLVKRPRESPKLPLRQPDRDDWQVKIVGVAGRFVLSLHRRQGRTLIYPNEVVEKRFGMAATTRNWDTIHSVCNVLKET